MQCIGEYLTEEAIISQYIAIAGNIKCVVTGSSHENDKA